MKPNPSALSPAELQTLLPAGCCLVDVREPIEHAEESIAGSQLIPLGQLEKRAGEISRDLPVVVMCQSGGRSAAAAEKLAQAGFQDVRQLSGGLQAWKSAGLPTAKSEKTVFPLMRQVQIVVGSGVLAGAILARLVHPDWIYLSGFFGAGLLFAGSTGWCGMAIFLSKMPWNRISGVTSCSTGNCADAPAARQA